MRSKRLSIPILVVGALLSVPSAHAIHHHGSGVSRSPSPGGWVGEVTNPYFPLHPGTTFHYEGETDGVPTSDDMAVTHDTKVIVGVSCTVVRDRGYTN